MRKSPDSKLPCRLAVEIKDIDRKCNRLVHWMILWNRISNMKISSNHRKNSFIIQENISHPKREQNTYQLRP
jgi:hypothetical protein